MAKYLARETVTSQSLSSTKQRRDKRKRESKKQEKIDRLIRRFDNLPTDTIEGWVNEDFDEMDAELEQSSEFYDDLSESSDMAIKATGTRWFNYYQGLGKFWEPIRRSCNENNKTTILIVRPNDPTIYRLSTRAGKELAILSQAISEGYILSRVKIHGGQVLD